VIESVAVPIHSGNRRSWNLREITPNLDSKVQGQSKIFIKPHKEATQLGLYKGFGT
jgi:hypothetical protein